jgi:hypothetical protein
MGIHNITLIAILNIYLTVCIITHVNTISLLFQLIYCIERIFVTVSFSILCAYIIIIDYYASNIQIVSIAALCLSVTLTGSSLLTIRRIINMPLLEWQLISHWCC